MKYAVLIISGKQYKVVEGEILEVDKILGQKGDKITLKEVLLIVDEEKREIGKPMITDAKVTVEILDQIKGEKIRVSKFKAKSRYRRVMGFRSRLTKIKIQNISQ